MSTELETIRGIARESLMPDFFGARVDEEGLWGSLQKLFAGLQLRHATVDKIKQFSSASSTASDFIEKIKAANLWLPLKDLVPKICAK